MSIGYQQNNMRTFLKSWDMLLLGRIEEIVTEEDADIVPISEMSKAQLMRFAKKHNIDTRGAKNVSEARRMIQKAMAEARV